MTASNGRPDDLEAWLHNLGLDKYAATFREHAIGLDVLPEIDDHDLRSLGMPLGDRKRLLRAAQGLGRAELGVPSAPPRESSPSAERRQVTILFADLVGSTALSTRLDPEDMGGLIQAYQHVCESAIVANNGLVANFVGDGVLAYFGYPTALEDDAERAVRAGLRITDETAKLTTPERVSLAARVGIATGLVVVGDLVGKHTAWEQAVVGETPNLAARLQAVAEPGSVVIGATTFRLVGGFFECRDLGCHELKGFAEPVQVWQALSERAVASRFEAAHWGHGLSPFAGRDDEIARLLDAWADARAGRGGVVQLVGEAGIGKSRLIITLNDRLADEPHTRLSYYCASYYKNSAFFPVINQLERAARFEAEDQPAAKLDKLEALLRQATDEIDEQTPLIAGLLSIPCADRYPGEQAGPALDKERTIAALLAQLSGLARRHPVVSVFEDLHWADPSTLELLQQLVAGIASMPVLLLLTYRPEFVPPWQDQPHVATLTLGRLGRASSAAIIEGLTEGKALPAAVLEQILARTDGVPLFVEELTKAVLESGELIATGDAYRLEGTLPSLLAVPSTLSASLMARLDRLGEAREVAQIGAVIGRDFPLSLLKAVADLEPPELERALAELCDGELVIERGSGSAKSYSFKHVLIQDVAYGGQLRAKRQALHARVADVLETQFPDTASTEPEVLAEHYTQAKRMDKAIAYWQRAGERALQLSAHAEAANHLRRGLDLCAGLPETQERAKAELGLLMTLGSALVIGRGYTAPEVEETYARARTLYPKIGDDPLFSRVPLAGLYAYYHGSGHFPTAIELGEQLLDLGLRQRDPTLTLDGHAALGLTLFTVARFAEARAHVDQDLSRHPVQGGATSTYTIAVEPGVAIDSFAGPIHWMLGEPDQARRRSAAAIARAKELDHPFSSALALVWAAVLSQLIGDVDRTREMGGIAKALTGEKGFVYWEALANCWFGWALAMQGEVEAGAAELRSGLDVKAAMGIRQCRSWCLCLLAQAERRGGRLQRARALVDEGLEVIAAIGEHFYEAELHRCKGEFLLDSSPSEAGAAEACFQRAIEIAQGQAARSWELRAATSLAKLWRGQGERQKAQDLLAPILASFTEGFDTQDLKEARALLEALR